MTASRPNLPVLRPLRLRFRSKALLGCMACALSLPLAMSGCAVYANYPPVGEDLAINDMNIAPAPTVMGVALRHVTQTYPVDGQYVVSLPEGMSRPAAERAINTIGDSLAWPVEPALLGNPVYHIDRVWILGVSATVDVMRPVTTLTIGENGAAQQTLEHQRVTLWLKSELNTWEVVATRRWASGLFDVPPLHGWPAESSRSVAVDPVTGEAVEVAAAVEESQGEDVPSAEAAEIEVEPAEVPVETQEQALQDIQAESQEGASPEPVIDLVD